MPRRVVAVVFALIFCALPVLAGGGEEGDWEFGLYLGYTNPDDYGGLNPEAGDIIGVRGGYFFTDKWSVEGAYQQNNTQADIDGPNPDIDLDSLRFNGLFNFRADHKLRWFLTAGIGRESTKSSSLDVDEHDLSYDAGGGVRWYFGKKKYWGLRVDGLWITSKVGGEIDATQSHTEVTGGLFMSVGGGEPPDSDSDHVPDKNDNCPGTPKGAAVDSKGCPKDTDGDGVADGLDKCANTPQGWKVDKTGCPADSDGDGVADVQDKCPDTPKGIPVNSSGCPTEDADGDGIADSGDRCPDTPKGAKVDPVGCPTDSDKDGVWDGLDKCPNTPPGTKVDSNGCPVP